MAVLLERVAYRPPAAAERTPPLAFLITAIGASFAIQYALFAWRGANPPEPAVIMFRPQPVFDIGGVIIDSQQITIFVAAIILMIIVDQFVNRTRLGRGLRAVAQDPDTATLMGVNKERVIVLTFLIGGILAGAAALFYVMKVPRRRAVQRRLHPRHQGVRRRRPRRHRQHPRRCWAACSSASSGTTGGRPCSATHSGSTSSRSSCSSRS